MNRRLLTLVPLAIAALAGCTKIVQTGVSASDYEITYQVVGDLSDLQRPKTRASSIAYGTNIPFVSYAWLLPAGRSWSVVADRAFATPYIDGETISYRGSAFRGTRPYFWPQEGSLTFMSISPATIRDRLSATVNGLNLSGWAQSGEDDGKDLMIADVAPDMTTNGSYFGYNGVPTLFRHKLARVSVSANVETDAGLDITINSITIANLYGVADIVNSEWANRRGVFDYVKNLSGDEGLLNHERKELISDKFFIPMYLAPEGAPGSDGYIPPASMTIAYTETEGDNSVEKTASFVFSERGIVSWDQSKSYHYHLIFGQNTHYIEFDASVESWGAEHNQGGIIFGEIQ